MLHRNSTSIPGCVKTQNEVEHNITNGQDNASLQRVLEMKWIKIKKNDLTFTQDTWTLTNAHLRAIGSFKIDTYVNRSVRGVIRNGYLYLQNYISGCWDAIDYMFKKLY